MRCAWLLKSMLCKTEFFFLIFFVAKFKTIVFKLNQLIDNTYNKHRILYVNICHSGKFAMFVFQWSLHCCIVCFSGKFAIEEETRFCVGCGSVFDTKLDYLSHLKANASHYEGKNICIHCGVCFGTGTELSIHIKFTHMKNWIEQARKLIWH